MITAVELAKYAITDAAIAEMSSRYMALKVVDAKDEAGCKAVHNARVIVKGKRCEVEKRRVELKADALAYGKAVDAEARRITALLTPIESYLDAQERIVTDEKERIRKTAEEAERIKTETAERAKREAEEKALADERAKLAAERAAMEAERAKVEAAQNAERGRLAAIEAAQRAEAETIAAEKRRIAEAEAAKQRAVELEKARAEAAERARVETEKRLAREAEDKRLREDEAKRQADAEQQRIAELRPDVEKIHEFGERLVTTCCILPSLTKPEAIKFLATITATVRGAAAKCKKFSAMEQID